MEPQQFDEVVAAFYEAAAGALPWTAALDGMARATGACGTHLLGIDPRSRRLMFAHMGGVTPVQSMVDYVGYWHARNPRLAPTMALGPQEWLHCHEHFDDAFVRDSPFYQEYLLPSGTRYTSNTRILDEPSIVVNLSVTRPPQAGPVRPTELEQLERLRAHLRRAYALYHANHSRTRAWDIGRQLLEELRLPTWVVDRRRQVLYRNRAAEGMVGRGDLLAEPKGNLRAIDIANQRRLEAVVDTLLQEIDRPNGLLMAPSIRVVRLSDARDKLPRPLFATPLQPGLLPDRWGMSPALMLTLHERDERGAPDVSAVASAFELTRAESRIAVSLALGRTVEQIAIDHSVAVATVRSQVKSLFQKTGARRQADVVRLIASLPDLAILAPSPAPAPQPWSG
jgi:DNA-binding CsgD family transcriptional regulator/PAS domain-containing protein